MYNYTIVLGKTARRSLDKIPLKLAEPIFSAIEDLSANPRPQDYKKLKGRIGYRIRVGNYRVIYDILDTELIIDVIDAGHRKDIYE